MPEQILGLRHLPARQGNLATVEATHARPLDRDCAAVEGELPFGPPPAVAGTSLGAAVARAAQALGVLRHHAGERGDPRRQAEALETRPYILPSPFYQRRRIRRRGRDIPLHGVAFLRGVSTPSLPAQGGQRRPSYFNIDRDIPGFHRIRHYGFFANGQRRAA